MGNFRVTDFEITVAVVAVLAVPVDWWTDDSKSWTSSGVESRRTVTGVPRRLGSSVLELHVTLTPALGILSPQLLRKVCVQIEEVI